MFEEDLDMLFFDWGEDITVQQGTNPSVKIKGIFDKATDAVNVFSGQVLIGMPRVVAKTSDVSSLVTGDKVTARSISYNLTSITHDGTGISTLELSVD